MRSGRRRMMWGAVVLAASMVASVGVVSASASAPGQGTFTHITKPRKDLRFTFRFGHANSFPVTGRTSLDVTQVDLVCLTFIVGSVPQADTLSSAVPVTNGQFSTTASFPNNRPTTNCRLRAIPAGVDVEGDYLGSFTGPIVYASGVAISKGPGAVPYAFNAYVEEGDGVALVNDAGSCGTEALVTVEAPQMVVGPVVVGCAFALPAENIARSASPTRSAIQVDGRNAYLPSGVRSLLIDDLALGLTQPALQVKRHVAHNGDTTLTETATLMRCSQSDTYPPTTTSCPSLVSTGVRFTRVSTVFRNGHQIKLRDSFTSTDHRAHSVTLQYQCSADNQTGGSSATGNVGYTYPRHPGTFRAAGLGKTITGLGSKAGSMFVRSDLRARSDDPTADTLAESWSTAPAKITYSTAARDTYGLQTSVRVSKHGAARLGFALSERWRTADVKKLAALAVADMPRAAQRTQP